MAPRLLVGVVSVLVLAGCCEGLCPTSANGATVNVLMENTLQGWTCPEYGYRWSTTDAALLVACPFSEHTLRNETCVASTVQCSGSLEVANAYVSHWLPHNAGRYYTCHGGFAWLSASKRGHFSQCLMDGNYSLILDVCEEDCDIPRDCTMIQDLGYNTSGLYHVIPQALPHSTVVPVWCDLVDNAGHNEVSRSESGWTLMLRNMAETGVMIGDFTNGFPVEELLNSSASYFLGINPLKEMAKQDSCYGCRLLVFKVLLEDSSGTEHHATYHGVNLNDLYLSSLGTYHGNAGDGLGPQATQTFMSRDDGTSWWGGLTTGADLTGADIKWPPLTSHSIRKVTMWVRPHAYDITTSCPALVGADPSWSTVTDVPLSRAPGTVVTYKCTGELLMEGTEGQSRTWEGTVICETNVMGNPAWNYSVVLPCTFSCPEGWITSQDKTHCYHFTTAVATHGIVSAALECNKMEGSLGIFNSTSDVSTAVESQFYFTAYTQRGTDITSITPKATVPDTLSCDSDCEASYAMECLVVSSESRKYVPCSDTTTYSMCMRPGYCPVNYTQYEGLCYKVKFDLVDDHKLALADCNTEGSSLAYPQNLDTLNTLTSLVHMAAVSAGEKLPVDVMVGLNNVRGNWTVLSIYDPDSDMVKAAEAPSSSGGWRILSVPSSLTDGPSFKEAQLQGHGATVAICQHLGLIGCWDPPYEPVGNMSRSPWNWENALTTVVNYTCYPGFFFDEDITKLQVSVECLGQLGGWYPDTLSPCVALEVCMGDLPTAPSSLITTNSSSDFRYLNGTANFTCPDSMGTETLVTVQTITCSHENDTYSFLPSPVAPCNVCLEEPMVGNAVTDWDLKPVWKIGMTVVATCNENYMASVSNDTQIVTCAETGWNLPPACYPACTASPPEAGASMTRDSLTSNAVNASVTYTCLSGFYIPIDETFPEVISEVNVTCSSSLQWVNNEPLLCSALCLQDPVAAPSGADRTWDESAKGNGSLVEYTCEEGLLFGNLNSTMTVTCQDGTWTQPDEAIFICRKPIEEPLPPFPDGVIMAEPIPTSFWVGGAINITCEEGKMTENHKNFTSMVYNGTSWSTLDPEFVCIDVVDEPLPPMPEGVVLDGSAPYLIGQKLNVTCSVGKTSQTDYNFFTISFNGSQWTEIDPQFTCST
ncbi:LOW QUALITY PROTEIN: uncharacterized protein [Panulirus ornatus]|uniref:LOW QUALITY PROTEIN: uncharacterized protein n=1 Tax=Panulirus ornatus TaxID=150431 RepID=UPI003A8B8284